jgi:hypothetical protein
MLKGDGEQVLRNPNYMELTKCVISESDLRTVEALIHYMVKPEELHWMPTMIAL